MFGSLNGVVQYGLVTTQASTLNVFTESGDNSIDLTGIEHRRVFVTRFRDCGWQRFAGRGAGTDMMFAAYGDDTLNGDSGIGLFDGSFLLALSEMNAF